jgi:L-threonylcarbamoyladenylate synthase
MMIDLNKAVTILRAGGLVAFPTETVYGLGADASNETAIRKIFRAKERPYDHPLIVHVANITQLADWARDISPATQKLAEAFWPGPLTIILKKHPRVLDIITGGQETIGLRIPRHPLAQTLLSTFGGGLAAPSANKFTHLSPTTAEAVQEELGDKVDLVLDGGACAVGLESTILDMSGLQPIILRPGMITTAQLAAILKCKIAFRQSASVIRAPGMHTLHYAPMTKTVVLAMEQIPIFLQSLNKPDLPVALVTYSSYFPLSQITSKCYHVKLAARADIYAHDLYQTLRALDRQQFKCIIIEAVPEGPAWEAIRDRLKKASGKR